MKQAKRDMRRPSRRPWRKNTKLWRGWKGWLMLENIRISPRDVDEAATEWYEEHQQISREAWDRLEKGILWRKSEVLEVNGWKSLP